MKRPILLLLISLFTIPCFSQFVEGFEDTPGIAGPLPAVWTLGSGNWAVFEKNTPSNVGTTQSWGINAFASGLPFQGSNCASISREAIGMGNTSEDYLVTPGVLIPGGDNSALNFYTRNFTSGNQGTFFQIKVALATAIQTDPNAYTTIQEWTENDLAIDYSIWQEKTVDLSAYAGSQIYIAFVRKYTQTGTSIDGDRWLIDDVTLGFNCDVFPGNCQPTLNLVAFTDTNNNGIKDINEQSFYGGNFEYQLNNSGSSQYLSSNGSYYGAYIIDANISNTYDIQFNVNSYLADYLSSNTTFSDVTVNASGTHFLYFPVTILQPLVEAKVSIVSNNARAGVNQSVHISYRNSGSVTIPNGTLVFTKDPIETINQVTGATVNLTSTGFTYDFATLLPGEEHGISVKMDVPPIPTVSLGQSITNSASVQVNGDAYLLNNNASTAAIVVASYDPNLITESHGEKIVYSTFSPNDYLYYTIMFENTGNAYAHDIRVEDFLDSNLDESTFEMITSSHNVNTRRTGNQLIWNFDNINLPPTATNPNSSHGYIHFRIKPKPGYAIGDVIPGMASIYFDTNPAIVTNTFNTEFVQALGNSNFNANSISLYPNPTSNLVTITNGAEKISKVTIYDTTGKRIYNTNVNSLTTLNIDVSNFAKGLYLVELSSADNLKITKKLIIK